MAGQLWCRCGIALHRQTWLREASQAQAGRCVCSGSGSCVRWLAWPSPFRGPSVSPPNTADQLRSSIACAGFVSCIRLFDSSLLLESLPDQPQHPLPALEQRRWRAEGQLVPLEQDLPPLFAPHPVGKHACSQVVGHHARSFVY